LPFSGNVAKDDVPAKLESLVEFLTAVIQAFIYWFGEMAKHWRKQLASDIVQRWATEGAIRGIREKVDVE
jgi:hypothetical protein